LLELAPQMREPIIRSVWLIAEDEKRLAESRRRARKAVALGPGKRSACVKARLGAAKSSAASTKPKTAILRRIRVYGPSIESAVSSAHGWCF